LESPSPLLRGDPEKKGESVLGVYALYLFKKDNMIYIGLFFGVIILFVIIQQTMRSKRGKKMEDYLSNISDFTPVKSIKDGTSSELLAINEQRDFLIVRAYLNGDFKHEIIKNKDLVEVSIETDSKTISKANMTGAIAGAVIAGGVGALIGSQAGKSQIERVKNIDLKLTTTSIEEPIKSFQIFSSIDNKGDKIDSFAVQESLKKAQEWEAIFKVALKKD